MQMSVKDIEASALSAAKLVHKYFYFVDRRRILGGDTRLARAAEGAAAELFITILLLRV